MIRGIKFISIPVRDQDAALEFYTNALGFKVQTDQEFVPGSQRWIELSIAGAPTCLSLFTPEGHEDRIGTFQPISFWCEDVFETAEGMKRHSFHTEYPLSDTVASAASGCAQIPCTAKMTVCSSTARSR